VEASRVDAALAAREDYYAVLVDEALVEVQEQALAQAEARLEEVDMKFRAGTASEFDLLTAQVEVDNIRPRLIEARNALALDRNRLKRTLNYPMDVILELTDELEEPGAEAPDAAVEYALEHRSDVQSQRLTVSLQQQNVSSQKAQALPSFDLVATLSRRGSSDQFFPSEQDFSQSATAALQFSVPIFDGRERAGLVQQAEAAVERERYRLEQLEGNVRLEVQQASQSLLAAREQVEASRSNVRRAERALEIAQTRFRNGLSTQVELNDAELAATEARTNYVEALYSYNVARARLAAALGER
jgi:outer membrane protein TolC